MIIRCIEGTLFITGTYLVKSFLADQKIKSIILKGLRL
jgi:hypothetical protein